jgi:2-keto-4-pentenoate hydratase/2-oxohepta-3-ene-1,7-dioic acid hydratase in catechol pathway
MTPFTPRLDDNPFPAPLGKIVCVGRNYAAHAAELDNPLPEAPLLFIKPATAAVALDQPLQLPAGQGAVHHELELALLIGAEVRDGTPAQALAAVAGIGLALDLTLREVQEQLKRQGHPWERAKAFDGACPLSDFIAPGKLDLQALTLQLWRNGQLRQDGETRQMLWPAAALLSEISRCFTLLPGDVVCTGTPAGVGPLASGDRLALLLGSEVPGDLLRVESRVA